MDASFRVYLSSAQTGGDLKSWVWGVHEFGKAALVRVACSVAREALPLWEEYSEAWDSDHEVFGSIVVADALEAAESWLLDPVAHIDPLEHKLAIAAGVVSTADFWVREGTCSAGNYGRQTKALFAGTACLRAAEAAAWVAPIPEDDDAEFEARRRAGPAFETVEAVWYAQRALDITDDEARVLITTALIAGSASSE